MENRATLRSDSYTAGQDGIRCAIHWGSVNTGDIGFADISQTPSHFDCYEWSVWKGKFSEYKISGVKIEVMPGRPVGQD